MRPNTHEPKSGTDFFSRPALVKLWRLSLVMRAVSVGYAAWVLWNMLNWWLGGDKVVRYFGEFLARDLSAAEPYQRYGALALDLLAWSLLVLAVFQGWKFLSYLTQPSRWSEVASRHIALCAWFAIGCEALAQVTRPFKSYLLTMHLPAAQQVWKWNFMNMDLLAVLLCLCLLMFAYVFRWTMEVQEENRSFV